MKPIISSAASPIYKNILYTSRNVKMVGWILGGKIYITSLNAIINMRLNLKTGDNLDLVPNKRNLLCKVAPHLLTQA